MKVFNTDLAQHLAKVSIERTFREVGQTSRVIFSVVEKEPGVVFKMDLEPLAGTLKDLDIVEFMSAQNRAPEFGIAIAMFVLNQAGIAHRIDSIVEAGKTFAPGYTGGFYKLNSDGRRIIEIFFDATISIEDVYSEIRKYLDAPDYKAINYGLRRESREETFNTRYVQFVELFSAIQTRVDHSGTDPIMRLSVPPHVANDDMMNAVFGIIGSDVSFSREQAIAYSKSGNGTLNLLGLYFLGAYSYASGLSVEEHYIHRAYLAGKIREQDLDVFIGLAFDNMTGTSATGFNAPRHGSMQAQAASVVQQQPHVQQQGFVSQTYQFDLLAEVRKLYKDGYLLEKTEFVQQTNTIYMKFKSWTAGAVKLESGALSISSVHFVNGVVEVTYSIQTLMLSPGVDYVRELENLKVNQERDELVRIIAGIDSKAPGTISYQELMRVDHPVYEKYKPMFQEFFDSKQTVPLADLMVYIIESFR
ncbi:hypothetical protein SM033_00284 [Vibrio phage vB_VpaM_sm033]|nr:hypothetical protein SM033_00284 [Vibrio phage vB_VpaM_sm033]